MSGRPVEEWLRDSLAEPPEQGSGEASQGASRGHLAPEIATAWIEGNLEPDVVASVEDHLAGCALCREWVMTASAALAAEPAFASRAQQWFDWRWAAAAAVAGAVLLLGWPDDSSPQKTAVSAINDPLAAARQGVLPEPDLFASVTLDRDEDRLRAGGQAGARASEPVPLSPRWARASSRRPVFVFLSRATSQEILLVDEEERLVAAIPVPEGRESEVIRVPLPEGVDDLTPEGLFAWKVGGWVDGEWRTSEFVPFRGPLEDPAQSSEDSTASPSQNPLAEVVSRAAAGLYEDALGILAGPTSGALAPSLRRQLAREILRRQHLPPALVQKELVRRLGPGQERGFAQTVRPGQEPP